MHDLEAARGEFRHTFLRGVAGEDQGGQIAPDRRTISFAVSTPVMPAPRCWSVTIAPNLHLSFSATRAPVEPEIEEEAKARNLASRAYHVLRDWTMSRRL